MELKLVPKLSQQQVMTPQLKMAIKLLTLNHLELQDAVAAEMVENPVLEEVMGEPGEAPPENAQDSSASGGDGEAPAKEVAIQDVGTDKQKDNAQEIDWEAYAESYSYLPANAGGAKSGDFDEMPGIDQTLTRAQTLEEHLFWQVRMSDLNAMERNIAVRLIGEMNDNGFLDASPQQSPPPLNVDADEAAEIAADILGDEPELLGDGLPEDTQPPAEAKPEEPEALLMDGPPASTDPVKLVCEDLDVPESWVENVRYRLMRFEPTGCLARDLRECLLVQLEVWGYDDECLVYNLVDKHFADVEKRNYQKIAKDLDIPLNDIGEALKILEQLEPRPAREFLPAGTTQNSQYITPDIYVKKVGDDYAISLNEDGVPRLRVSQFYLDQLAAAARGDPSKSYIREKMRSATWLIRSIHQRQQTIYRVVESILKHQRDWFDNNGPLKPLILREVADDIERHESTVSRVTTRKYLHCHRGIFELKYFFNSSIATGDGASIASESVKDEIKTIIAGENPKKPLSDSAIVKLLKEKDIKIARRTVAKYREMLGILPSSKRKQVFD